MLLSEHGMELQELWLLIQTLYKIIQHGLGGWQDNEIKTLVEELLLGNGC